MKSGKCDWALGAALISTLKLQVNDPENPPTISYLAHSVVSRGVIDDIDGGPSTYEMLLAAEHYDAEYSTSLPFLFF